MSLFANLMAVTRLDNVDISDIVLQAVKGEYWLYLSHYLCDRFASVNPTLVLFVCLEIILLQKSLQFSSSSCSTAVPL